MASTSSARSAICALIRSADRRVTESVKWNAPSFAITSHFATLRAQPELLQVVLHTDAKPVTKRKAIVVADPTRLLTWPATEEQIERAMALTLERGLPARPGGSAAPAMIVQDSSAGRTSAPR